MTATLELAGAFCTLLPPRKLKRTLEQPEGMAVVMALSGAANPAPVAFVVALAVVDV